MPNNYFQFKQFTVFQDKCAMKVCTDACLFGAVLPSNSFTGEFKVLDIGTGTGLLSLMYAQKNPQAIIDAIEIDNAAAGQARDNFSSSPWAKRLHITNTDVLDLPAEKKYDHIFSNPPFFEDDLHSPDAGKNNAKHDTALSLVQLLETVNRLLNNEGSFAVLLPFKRLDYFIEEALKYDLHLSQQILVKQTPAHDFFRVILFFGRIMNRVSDKEIIIKDKNGKYTTAFAEVLKDYYLHL